MSVLMLMSTLGFMLMLDADVYVDGAVSDYAVVVDVVDVARHVGVNVKSTCMVYVSCVG